jgi:nicotinamidase-related amidase
MHQVITPDEAKALVERMGSQTEAARHMGVPRTTFRHWLYPEKGREKARKWYQENKEHKREQSKRQYWSHTPLELAERRLKIRRIKALHRMAARNRRQKKDEAA